MPVGLRVNLSLINQETLTYYSTILVFYANVCELKDI